MDKRFCIFDMDGTLADSMPFWIRLGRDYLEGLGFRPTAAQLAKTDTMTMEESAVYFRETFAIPETPEQIFADMYAVMGRHYRRDIPLKAGALEYLKALKARGARLCVATATEETMSRACMERLGAWEYLDFLLSCETLGVSKTRPDIYLEAAARFGAAPGEIAVFEDSLYALETARAAGFYTVAVAEPAYAGDWDALSALADETITDWRNAI